jgi:hypothetical protein
VPKISENTLIGAGSLRWYSAEAQIAFFKRAATGVLANRDAAREYAREVMFGEDLLDYIKAQIRDANIFTNRRYTKWNKRTKALKLWNSTDYMPRRTKPGPAVLNAAPLSAQISKVVDKHVEGARGCLAPSSSSARSASDSLRAGLAEIMTSTRRQLSRAPKVDLEKHKLVVMTAKAFVDKAADLVPRKFKVGFIDAPWIVGMGAHDTNWTVQDVEVRACASRDRSRLGCLCLRVKHMAESGSIQTPP